MTVRKRLALEFGTLAVLAAVVVGGVASAASSAPGDGYQRRMVAVLGRQDVGRVNDLLDDGWEIERERETKGVGILVIHLRRQR